ncbi:MAG: low-specificity L-threonine aldolase [Sphaerochaetaceae bacterium]|jgi:threonine aldolase|nr:low-specificity L-threonine aldolase [Sphaerochaetaceae bacterium]MDD4220212.1 low-specificity L-threonine aldolase [Sphaerochaetaceae bacterium]MDY0371819.1 low-specificity L-threonine aldolase [Sphaerochaetaceae bacterium]
MPKIYDLRSDTVTKPSSAMRKAMANAEVGDDVYFEDPTVNRLEAMAAERLGKEAALFVTSGSMGNLIPLFLLAGRGSEVLTHSESHIIQHEVGAMASIAGAIPIAISSPRGLLSAPVLEPLIKPKAYDLARTAVIEVENTIKGVCYPLKTLQDIKSLAEKYNLTIHMDGARLFNAAVATGIDVSHIAKNADTVSFCLSKGLGAPVGSMLCGTQEFIKKARSIRKMLGGGMRQAGILAAAGIYALEHNVGRLAEDHTHAKQIAQTLAKTEWAQLNVDDTETNIIFFSVPKLSGAKVASILSAKGILCSGSGSSVRLVTNLDLNSEDITAVCDIIASTEAKEFTL